MKVVLTLFLLFVDLAIYLFLGVYMMKYDDFYHEEEGPYWSWESMEWDEQLVSTLLFIWIWLNIAFAVYLGFRLLRWLYRRYRNSPCE